MYKKCIKNLLKLFINFLYFLIEQNKHVVSQGHCTQHLNSFSCENILVAVTIRVRRLLSLLFRAQRFIEACGSRNFCRYSTCATIRCFCECCCRNCCNNSPTNIHSSPLSIALSLSSLLRRDCSTAR